MFEYNRFSLLLKVGSGRPSGGTSESLHPGAAVRRRPLLPHLHHVQRRRSLRGGVPALRPVQPPAARPGGVSRHTQAGALPRPGHRHPLRQHAGLPHHPGGVPQVRGRSRLPQHVGRGGRTRLVGRQGKPAEDAGEAERCGDIERGRSEVRASPGQSDPTWRETRIRTVGHVRSVLMPFVWVGNLF